MRTLTKRAQIVCNSHDSLTDETRLLNTVFIKHNHSIDFIERNHLTLKMASAQAVKTSVAKNSPFQDCNHSDYHFQSRYITPGIKPFTEVQFTLVLTKFIASGETYNDNASCTRLWRHLLLWYASLPPFRRRPLAVLMASAAT